MHRDILKETSNRIRNLGWCGTPLLLSIRINNILKRSNKMSVRDTRLLRRLVNKDPEIIESSNFSTLIYHFPGKSEAFLKRHYQRPNIAKN